MKTAALRVPMGTLTLILIACTTACASNQGICERNLQSAKDFEAKSEAQAIDLKRQADKLGEETSAYMDRLNDWWKTSGNPALTEGRSSVSAALTAGEQKAEEMIRATRLASVKMIEQANKMYEDSKKAVNAAVTDQE